MTSLSDRLRGVIRPGGGPPEGGPYDDDRGSRLQPTLDHSARDAIADVLDGQWHERDGQRFLVVDRTYVPGYRHGSMVLADSLPPSDGMWPRLSLLANGSCGSRLLFVDLETTGIAGGAGTYAFLVGCGWFDGGVFRTRQYFLSSFTAERVLLEDVADLAAKAGAVVTYNGKTFDLPLIETRYNLHRLDTPFAGLPHIDMLHPARRMWRAPESACRLVTLEQTLCGYVREGDVPGFEIPARYFRYVHGDDARPLAAVFEHNRLDLVSLALLTARAAQLLDEGAAAARTAQEALGMGRLYERGGMMADAKACYARATEIDGDEDVRADALRSYALVCRRMRHFDDAAAAWQRVLGLPMCPWSIAREASEALAVHLEHRRRDPRSARAFALRLLQVNDSPVRRQAAEYRLARLDRKLDWGARQAALF
jgi:uncharacterized protein YprB with RNaseH-like and TPR domain